MEPAVAFTTKVGKIVMSFVTNEADGVIVLRDIAGQVTKIQCSDVTREQHLPQSMMRAGLANTLSADEFTDLIDYLVSLKGYEE